MISDYLSWEMGGGKRKHPEGGIRINYLHQARHHVLRRMGGPVARLMAASMGQHMVAVGKKSQVRLDGDMKKTLCKVGHCVSVNPCSKVASYFSSSGLWWTVDNSRLG